MGLNSIISRNKPGQVLPENTPINPDKKPLGSPKGLSKPNEKSPLASPQRLASNTSISPSRLSIELHASRGHIEKYKTKKQFADAIIELSRPGTSFEESSSGGSYGSDVLKSIDQAWALYTATKKVSGPFILGRLVDGKVIPDCDDSYPCIDQPLLANAGRISSRVGSNGESAGGILDIPQEAWSLAVNDAFILGAIHNGLDIYFASSIDKNNIWNEKEGRLTVTARELIGILDCGKYKMVKSKSDIMGTVAKFDHTHEGGKFGFKEYLSSIKKYSSDEKLIRSLHEIKGESIKPTGGN